MNSKEIFLNALSGFGMFGFCLGMFAGGGILMFELEAVNLPYIAASLALAFVAGRFWK